MLLLLVEVTAGGRLAQPATAAALACQQCWRGCSRRCVCLQEPECQGAAAATLVAAAAAVQRLLLPAL